jgi:hypothetical protein
MRVLVAAVVFLAVACGPPDPTPNSALNCASNADCRPADYCRKGADGCDGRGICTARGSATGTCLTVVVCGCDGVLYGTPCEAAAAGVSGAGDSRCSPRDAGAVDAPDGAWAMRVLVAALVLLVVGCEPPPEPRPDVPFNCGSNADCPPAEFCNKPYRDCAGRGHCELRRPESQSYSQALVCGATACGTRMPARPGGRAW